MAKGSGVWGIDVGQCALKALRCRMEGDTVVADGFDFIEYPKLLSQPEANPTELIRESLDLFLSRNKLKGDKVCISVGGQLGLAKYFKPPPVDAKKLPDIVKYEARQQIPFNLNDVIWDYQRMGGGAEVDGIMLESEIGLFAMKREQVFKSIAPFDASGIPLDVIQLAPLSIYSAVVYDQLQEKLPPPEDFDPENPPPSTLVISLGTDATDLLVTNGYRLWQRNIPLGGSSFTKQLTKELKLTFAKAEHLKRNAHTAEDPRAVFQAMRPVFNDIVSEIQRSINFFHSLDRKAKITKMMILGNACKLPGLKQYLQKHLSYELVEMPKFERLKGDDVVGAAAFNDNMLSFATTYGLCLQGLGQGTMKTNLIPREILTDRMIRAKRPWAVAALGALLLGMAGNYVFHYSKYSVVTPERWSGPTASVTAVSSKSSEYKKKDEDQTKQLETLEKFGEGVVGNRDRKMHWMELYTALNQALPFTPGTIPSQTLDPAKVPFDQQWELHIDYVESKFFQTPAEWAKTDITNRITQDKSTVAEFALQRQQQGDPMFAGADIAKDITGSGTNTASGTNPAPANPAPANPAPANPAPANPAAANPAPANPAAPANNASAAPAGAAPTGAGYAVEISGYHYFYPGNDQNLFQYRDRNHVLRTIIANLTYGGCILPIEIDGTTQKAFFTFKDIGITSPVLVGASDSVQVEVQSFLTAESADPAEEAEGAVKPKPAATPAGETKAAEAQNKPYRTNFKIQFFWQEVSVEAKKAILANRIKAAEAAAAAATAQPAAGNANGTAPNTVPPANGAAPNVAVPNPSATNVVPPANGGAPATASPPSGSPGNTVPSNTAQPVPAGAPMPVTEPPVTEPPEAEATTEPAQPPVGEVPEEAAADSSP
jgi:type IV pilus assembly protein PilM